MKKLIAAVLLWGIICFGVGMIFEHWQEDRRRHQEPKWSSKTVLPTCPQGKSCTLWRVNARIASAYECLSDPSFADGEPGLVVAIDPADPAVVLVAFDAGCKTIYQGPGVTPPPVPIDLGGGDDFIAIMEKLKDGTIKYSYWNCPEQNSPEKFSPSTSPICSDEKPAVKVFP